MYSQLSRGLPSSGTQSLCSSPRRVNELWFNDCGLVIRAGNLLFRVSGEILATKSPIFHDMLQIPQPPSSEMVDGCPVVQLHDHPADATNFLRAVFDSEFFEPYPSETDFETIHGVLKLSNKYLVDYLRRRALVHLSSRYPSSLDMWTNLSPSWTPRPREVSALWVLPTAFYALCVAASHSSRVLSRGVTFQDRVVKLTEADLEIFLDGSCRQREAASTILQFLWHPESLPGCHTGSRCFHARCSERRYSDGRLYELGCQPLEIWGTSEWEELPSTICPVCIRSMKLMHCWEDLEQMKIAALQ
ncbi:hypothetical protein C8J57DRAFT_1401007 [Mycena rebaudengoi]|nr:hypothetical protein C8J57DRAFT_1401007 [Mycena rebaudengoi]